MERSATKTQTRYCMRTWSHRTSTWNRPYMRRQSNRSSMGSRGSGPPIRSRDNGPPMRSQGNRPPTRVKRSRNGGRSMDIVSSTLIFWVCRTKPKARPFHSCLICRRGHPVNGCRLLWVLAGLVQLSVAEPIMKKNILLNGCPNNYQHLAQKQRTAWCEASASLAPWGSRVC